jgi:hypothetical protein
MRHRVLRHSFGFRRKVSLGVDYGNCRHRMAEDIDAAPTLSILAKSSNHSGHCALTASAKVWSPCFDCMVYMQLNAVMLSEESSGESA